MTPDTPIEMLAARGAWLPDPFSVINDLPLREDSHVHKEALPELFGIYLAGKYTGEQQ